MVVSDSRRWPNKISDTASHHRQSVWTHGSDRNIELQIALLEPASELSGLHVCRIAAIEWERSLAQLKLIRANLTVAEGITARSYLEAFGIHVALAGYHHGTVAWHHVTAIGGLQLWVFDSDEEIALRLLSTPALKRKDEQLGPESAIRRASILDLTLAALAFVMTGLPLPTWTRRRQRADDYA